MTDANFFPLEAIQNETGLFIFTKHACEGASAAQTRGCNQSRGGQTAAMPFAPLDTRLPVSGWKCPDEEQLINRGAADAQNVKTRRHFTMKPASGAWPAGLP